MSRPDQLGADILKALGVDPSVVVAFTLECSVGNLPRLTIERRVATDTSVEYVFDGYEIKAVEK